VSTTFTAAVDRDRLHDRARRTAQPDRHQLLLVLVSVVALMAIALSYVGKTRASAMAGRTRTVTDLNAVTDARQLERALEPAFSSLSDRRFAAAHLAAFVLAQRKESGAIPNVGALMAATVSAEAVERGGSLEYQGRLRRAAERAEAQRSARPTRLPLLTADDLAAVKPGLVVRSTTAFRSQTLLWTAVYLLSIWSVALVWWLRGRGDFALLGAAHLLTAIGFALVLSRSDPLRDTLLFVRYAHGVLVGCVGLAIASSIDFRRSALAAFTYLPLAAALVLSAVLLLFGGGPAGSNAKVNLGPVQPVEAIRLLLGLFLAGYFARRWELLRQIRGRTVRQITLPDWLHLPRFEYLLPVVVGTATALVFFFLQRDLGPALFVSCVFLAIYAVARNRAGLAIAGLAVLTAGFYAGYLLNISSTLSARVHMWRSAWDNVARGGDQIAQAMWALGTGGVFGTGLGLGDTRYVPAGYTDLPLAAIGEELGFVGVLCVLAAFGIIGWRGYRTALRATNDYAFFLATILTLFLIFPVLLMAAGMLGVVPLTGVVTPFVSFGGSAMVANFTALGLLAAIARTTSSVRAASVPFTGGMRALASTCAVAALVLIGVLVDVQVVRADTYAAKPHLGLQADGIRRYQYNPRILDVVAQIPRGTVYDRNGLPLATNEPSLIESAPAEYQKRGVEIAGCEKSAERCYPLGPAAFHLLGDLSTRRNWGAGNSSYVERDLQDRLRGFDDHAAAVAVVDVSGRSAPTMRRDYRDVVPLLRHRYRPGSSDVREFRERTRDVTLTIDGPFQARVARILAKHAARTPTGRAAAVVIDPASGDVLASVSYPLPDTRVGGTESRVPDDEDAETQSVFDRARYGLYAPGSTFKLVTAAAALRLDPSNWNDSFICSRQDHGRVGARVPEYGLVRDDPKDEHPHGSIAMRDAIVQSCNAYFAQLAARIGVRPLLDTAALAGISVARDNSASRLRSTLAHAAYGQGDVVATPLRMARIAAAIANGGLLREPRIARAAVGTDRSTSATATAAKKVGPSGEKAERLLTPDSAARLANALRDAVVAGTGRSVSAHPGRIAGKTGTAEVANAPSHAWFVGFAPHRGKKQIAFAVLFEHAGYGGAVATPAAGEIVTAAAARGLIE
jgi:cell division protein FtsI/penicillin-binding protein 2/cell division protein FtsW (lipid II flippase)